MASFVATRLLYAALFFMLGAWVASVSPDFKSLVHRASATSVAGFEMVRDWTSSTLRGSAPAEKPKAVAPKPETPKASAPKSAESKAAASAPETPGTSGAPATVASAALDASTGGELLIRARQAFAMGDMIGSINAYRAYIDRNPDAMDARGELGNVYFAEGRRHDAAEMYLEVAVLRLKAGDIAGAKAMLDAVRLTDATLGADLVRRIGKAEGDKK